MSIPGWFPQTSRNTLEFLISGHEIATVIEIGSFVGLSTVFFAEHCDRVITIDTFDAARNSARHYLEPQHQEVARDQYMSFLRNTIRYPNITGLATDSLTASTLDMKADLVYIDGDHNYEAVKADIGAWTPKARRILAGDDYHWPGVRAAVDELDDIETDGRVWWQVLS